MTPSPQSNKIPVVLPLANLFNIKNFKFTDLKLLKQQQKELEHCSFRKITKPFKIYDCEGSKVVQSRVQGTFFFIDLAV